MIGPDVFQAAPIDRQARTRSVTETQRDTLASLQ